jgi:anion transporter
MLEQSNKTETAKACCCIRKHFTNNPAVQHNRPFKTMIALALSWGAFFIVLFVMPTPAGMSAAAMATLAVVVWACITWIGEVVPVGVTGMQIPMLLLLSGAVENFGQAVSGYTSTAAFICLAAFIMTAIIQCAGLDRRIALSLLHRAKVKSVNGVIWAMLGVNMILAMVVPGAHSRAALQLPVVNGLVRLLGDTARERDAKKAIVIQSMVYGSMIAGICILTAHLPNLVIVGLFDQQLNIKISFFQWFVLQFPYLGMFVLTHFWVRWHFKTRDVAMTGGADTIAAQHSALPMMSRTEWHVLGCFSVAALLWMSESLHGISSEMVAAISISILFIPGLLNFNWKDIQDRTIWGTYMMFAGALSLSSAMSSTGLGRYLADLVHGIAQGHSWWVILFLLMAGTHVIRLGMLSNVAAVSLLAPILLELAPKLGLHPVAFTMLIADTDTFAYILPTQITVSVIAYSTGTFSMADYVKVGWVSTCIGIAYGLCVMAPWYAFLGIPVWDPDAPWPF